MNRFNLIAGVAEILWSIMTLMLTAINFNEISNMTILILFVVTIVVSAIGLSHIKDWWTATRKTD